MQKSIIIIGVLGLILSSLIIRLMVHNFIIEDAKGKATITINGQVKENVLDN